MTRLDFLKLVGFGAVTASAMYCLGGCSSNSVTAPSNVDFTIDLSDAAYTALSSQGNYIIKNGIIVAHTIDGNYVAVSAACTHEGTNVKYVSAKNDFYCPSHGSQFSTTGSVQNGPANRPLTQYHTSLNANILRIYS